MLLFLSSMVFLTQTAIAIPQQFTQQGRVIDGSGIPITGIHTITVRIYDSAAGGQMLWDESQQTLLNNGFYSVFLGANSASNPLDDSIFEIGSIYLEIEIDNDGPLSPRTEIVSVPYARQAKTAFEVDGGVVNASEIRVDGNVVVDGAGNWIGQSIQSNWSDITNMPSDFSDGVDDDSDTLNDLMVSCSDGQIPKYDVSLGWNCSHDDVLTESDVEGYIKNEAIDLASGSMVNGDSIVTLSTDQFLDESAVENYIINESINLADGSMVNGDMIVTSNTDQVLSESDVETYVSNGAIDLADGSMVNGDSIVTSNTDKVLSESDVEGYVTDSPIDLAEGTTVNGKTILTATCPEGQILASNGSGWDCMEFQVLLDADNDSVMAWNDCNDNDPNIGDKTLDADCDGFVTGDDCDDNNADLNISDGGTANCASTSCLDILNDGYSTGTGLYYIDPMGGSPYQVYCDMDTDGGGWTMVANNNNSDTEESGCFPRVSGYSPDFCGSVSSSSDFTVNASGISFTGMVWAAYTDDFDIASYQYFTWNSNREISTASTWSIQADNYNQTLSDYSGLDKIYCTHSGYNRLEYVRLQNTLGGIVSRNTVFSVTSSSYELSFMDEQNASHGQTQGLDDWQDGDGCGDSWTPVVHRGYSSFVMIR